MSINLSRVNISLDEFQRIANGKYNAGEVKLTGQHTLGRVNHHIHLTGLNNTAISHAEVVAIKNAFVRALGEGGVSAESVAKIRVQLGLAPSCAADAKLAERSMKPLSRQQIRDILDKYAGVLKVRTVDEIKAGVPQAVRQTQAETRQSVNNSLDANRTIETSETLDIFQKVLAGDVDFAPAKDYGKLLSEAKRQLSALYAACGDNPSAQKQAKARCEMPGGQCVEIDTGMTEAAYAEKLFQTVARLEYMDVSTHRQVDCRREYQNLDHAGRMNWIDHLPDADCPLVMARTAAIVALQEKGVDDFEALSLVNTITLGSVVDLLKNLEDPEHNEHWAMTRDNIVAIMRQYPVQEDGNSGRVYIPATSPSQCNKALRAFFKGVSETGTPPAPPGFKTFALGLLAELRGRFGEDVVPAGGKLDTFIADIKLGRIVQVEGDGDYAVNVPRATLDGIRGEVVEMVRGNCAKKAVLLFAAGVAKEMGVELKNENLAANAILLRHKNLVADLCACENREQVDEILGTVRDDAVKAVNRCAMLDGYRRGDGFKRLVREELSALTGLPAESLKGGALEETRLRTLAIRLADKINSGEIQADSEDEILGKFREEARKFAEERKACLDKVDRLEVTDATKAELKIWILAQAKVSFIDFDDILGKMEDVDDRAWRLSEALRAYRQKGDKVTPADKDAVYAAMKRLAGNVDELVDAQFEARHIDADYIEKTALGTIVTILALGRFVDIRDDIAHFMARPDVSAEMAANRENLEHPASWALRFETYAAPDVAETNAKIRDDIASGTPDALTGQAVWQGCRDAGMTGIKPEEALALFTAGKILSGELLKAIDGLPAIATPQMIRTIVCAVAVRYASQIENGRPKSVLLASPAERKTAIINKIAGGDGAAAVKARRILDAKIGPESQNPEAKTIGEVVRNVRVLLLKGVLADLKSVAKGGKGSYLRVDFNRNPVNLAGVGTIKPEKSEEAADSFARFVTGRKDATYAGLSRKDKAKADFAMAMAAQTSQNALLIGFAVMMDPDGRDASFLIPGSSQGGVWSVGMEFGEKGELKVNIAANVKPDMVALKNGEALPCKAGSTFKIDAGFTFTASELNRLADIDFSKYDSKALDNRLVARDQKDKYEGAIDLIPGDCRINAGITIDVEGDFK